MPNYTREQPKEVSLPVRLPLIGIPNQRAGSRDEDSRLINGYVEMGQDEVLRVVKRPGLVLHATFSGPGKGMLVYGTTLYSIFGGSSGGGYIDNFYANSTLIGSSIADASESVAWSSEIVPAGAEEVAFFLHDRRYTYTYMDGDFLQLPFQGDAAYATASITLGSPVVTVADTSGLTTYSVVTGTGIPASTAILSIDSATQFTMTNDATATNAAASLIFALGGLPPRAGVVSINTLAQLAYGVVDLNKSTYVFTYRSIVAGSDIDAPRDWNPLNIIYAYADQDSAVAIAKQLSYIVAFKGQSTEFFRDVGASPGSPLERLEGLRLAVGCYNGRTVADIDGTLVWCSLTESGLKSVWLMQNAKAEEIAWPSVRRVLERLAPAYAISFSSCGHTFYVLTDPDEGVSLVYDLTSKFWSYWNALGETYFPFVAADHIGSTTYLQHESNGKIYMLDHDAYDDDGEDLVMDIYPPQFDANMRISKYVARMYVVADQAEGSILEVRSSESDQTDGSWSNWREFDLSKSRPDLYDCGSFTKRFYHFRHSSATRCRLTAIEMDLLPGTL